MEQGIPPEVVTAGLGVGFTILIVILVVWDAVWKAIAMWKAARLGHKAWFIIVLIFNTVGILPIIYIFAVAKPAERKAQSQLPLKEQSQ